MDDLLAARAQMALSLGFHILFAVVGMAMPLLSAIAEGMWLRTRDEGWKILAQQWSRGTAILFAVGAVSGTVLSFELGLLWPHFMEWAGPVIGMPFSLEGFAFFLEAIFLGLYLYGWQRLPPFIHWLTGIAVTLCGWASGVFVVAVNAWMNTPVGFTLLNGKVVEVDVWAALFNPAMPTQVIHMLLAAVVTVGFGVAAIHAYMVLGDPNSLFHRRAYLVGLAVGGVAAVLQPLSGDFLAKQVARNQPVKLAAMEAHWDTMTAAPLHLGGWPDEVRQETSWAIKIPYGLSFLAYGDPHAEVKGLKEFPRELRPPVLPVHLAFQVMVGAGTVMMGVAGLGALLWWRRRNWLFSNTFLKLVILCGPLGVLALETGWVVTEVGRQPWIITGYMRTADALTPVPGLIVPFTLFSLLYLFLSLVVVQLMRKRVVAAPHLSNPEETHGLR